MSRRFSRALKGRLGYDTRPKGRQLRSFGWSSLIRPDILGSCLSIFTRTSRGQPGDACR